MSKHQRGTKVLLFSYFSGMPAYVIKHGLHFLRFFLVFYLHMSKKSCNFAGKFVSKHDYCKR